LAITYGRPETEKDLLSQSPNSISKFEDIEPVHQKLKEKLSEDKNHHFFVYFLLLFDPFSL